MTAYLSTLRYYGNITRNFKPTTDTYTYTPLPLQSTPTIYPYNLPLQYTPTITPLTIYATQRPSSRGGRLGLDRLEALSIHPTLTIGAANRVSPAECCLGLVNGRATIWGWAGCAPGRSGPAQMLGNSSRSGCIRSWVSTRTGRCCTEPARFGGQAGRHTGRDEIGKLLAETGQAAHPVGIRPVWVHEQVGGEVTRDIGGVSLVTRR